ncbi:ribbon-helix-helix domain-containing protein [Niveispirillum sp. KHB5.9]|uniref:ribbon-helix-helix domain-containing protein n=1 Tax=Niveispirillum sp. KHB5.9 TaxID=3400269 RepID=UPI003A8B8A7D
MQNLLRILGQTSYEQRRRDFTVDGRRVSACISQECWDALEDIAVLEGVSLETLVCGVARRCGRRSLSLELDLFVISYYQTASLPADGLRDIEPANLLPC